MNKKTKRLQLLNSCVKQIESLPWITQDGEPIQIKNTFICPICLKTFILDKYTENELNNIISLEDVPPKSIGGKPILVTCKKCNNTCGHNIDIFLLNELKYRQDIKSTQNRKATLSHDGIQVNATFSIKNDKSIQLLINKANDPNKVRLINESLNNSEGNWNMNVQITSSEVKRNPTAADIALLKSAYLLAFKKLGYRYIVNSSLKSVREQVLNPDKTILSSYIVGNEGFINKNIKDGIYRALYNNDEILMVIFSYKLGDTEHIYRKAIALPPIDLKTDIYDVLSKNKTFTIKIIEEILETENYTIYP